MVSRTIKCGWAISMSMHLGGCFVLTLHESQGRTLRFPHKDLGSMTIFFKPITMLCGQY